MVMIKAKPVETKDRPSTGDAAVAADSIEPDTDDVETTDDAAIRIRYPRYAKILQDRREALDCTLAAVEDPIRFKRRMDAAETVRSSQRTTLQRAQGFLQGLRQQRQRQTVRSDPERTHRQLNVHHDRPSQGNGEREEEISQTPSDFPQFLPQFAKMRLI